MIHKIIFSSFLIISILVAHKLNICSSINEKYLAQNFSNNKITQVQKSVSKSKSVYIKSGDNFTEDGFPNLAEQEYMKAIKKEDSVIAYIKLINVQIIQKKFKRALQSSRIAQKKFKDEVFKLFIAKLLIQEGDLAQTKVVLNGISSVTGNTSYEKDYYLDILKIIDMNTVDPNYVITNHKIFEKSKNIQSAFDEFKIYKDGNKLFFFMLISKQLIKNK